MNADQSLRSLRRWRGMPGAYPRLADALLAVTVAAAIVCSILFGWFERDEPRPGDVLAWLLLAIACAAVYFHRTRPLAATVTTVVCCVFYYPLGSLDGPLLLTFVVTLFSLAVSGRIRAAILLAAVALFLAIGAEALSTPRHLSNLNLFLLTGWLVALLAVGVVLRNRAVMIRQASEGAADAERLRIAREIHDVVAHHISLINVQATAALRRGDPATGAEALGVIREASKTTLVELRSVLGLLRAESPAGLRHIPPAGAGIADVADLVEQVRASGLAVDLSGSAAGNAIPGGAVGEEVSRAAYRIIQEALTNVTRHSGASHASVGIATDDDRLVVTVRDNGHGRAPAAGNGIRGMRERARLLGGTLSLGAAPGGGLELRAELPLADRRTSPSLVTRAVPASRPSTMPDPR